MNENKEGQGQAGAAPHWCRMSDPKGRREEKVGPEFSALRTLWQKP